MGGINIETNTETTNIHASQLNKRLWRYGPLLFWFLIIFFASTDQFSKENTSKTITPLLQWVFANFSEQTIDFLNIVIRKSGHFIGYAVLAFFAVRALVSSNKSWLSQNWFFWALLIVIFYSFIDEFHQSFGVSRTASLYDCIIDIAGGLTYLIVFSYLKKKLKLESAQHGK